MKILLDENLPKKLKLDFDPAFEVRTVREMNWQGKKNGELLGMIAFNGFDIFITIDRNLQYQKNLDKFDVSIFVLMAVNNRRETLQTLIKKVIDIIHKGDFKKLTIVA